VPVFQRHARQHRGRDQFGLSRLITDLACPVLIGQATRLKPQIPRISQILRELSGDERSNLLVTKLQGIDIHNLLYPCNLRNLRLNPFRFFCLTFEI